MNIHETPVGVSFDDVQYALDITAAGAMSEAKADIECERLFQIYKSHGIKKATIAKDIKAARIAQKKADEQKKREQAAKDNKDNQAFIDSFGEDPRTIDQLLAQSDITELQAAQCVAAMNRNHSFILDGGKATVLRKSFDPEMNRDVYQRLSVVDFCTAYQNVKITVAFDAEGEPITKPLGTLWIYSEQRRQYLDGIIFDPSGKEREGCLNLWTGFAVQEKKGSWKRMRRHIWKNLCKKNKAAFRYLMNWLAMMFQHPEQRGYACVVLRGLRGAGKGVFGEAIKRIFSAFALQVFNGKHIVGNFNRHLQTVVFLFSDEAIFAGDKGHESVLKGLITEPYLDIEAKFRDLVEAVNRLHIMMASNEAWVVPAGMDERRFFVLDVSDEFANNHEYFAPIIREMKDEGGDAAMLHDLLRLDVSKFNPAVIPQTQGLQEQKKLSMGLEWKWYDDVLARGYVLESKHGCEEQLHQWFSSVTMDALYASYEAFVAKQRRAYPNMLSREKFGVFLRSSKTGLGLTPCKSTSALLGERRGSRLEDFKGVVMLNEQRKPGYQLNALKVARDQFAERTKFEVYREEELGRGFDEEDYYPPEWADPVIWTNFMNGKPDRCPI